MDHVGVITVQLGGYKSILHVESNHLPWSDVVAQAGHHTAGPGVAPVPGGTGRIGGEPELSSAAFRLG